MRWLEKVAFHPIVLAFCIPLACLASLFPKIVIERTIPIILVYATVVTTFFLALRFFIRDWRKAGLLASFVCLWLVDFRTCYQFCNSILQNTMHFSLGREVYLLPYLMLLALIFWVIPRLKFYVNQITFLLNISSLGLLAYLLLQLILLHFKTAPAFERVLTENQKQGSQIQLAAINNKPDIYYIILDAFSSSAVLSKYYDYDNSTFIAQLKDRGFYVAPLSHSNYDRTILSFASFLNMRYLDSVGQEFKRYQDNWCILIRLAQENQIASCLKRIGYKFINVSSGFFSTSCIPNADKNIHTGWGSWLKIGFCQLTPIAAQEDSFQFMGNAARQKVLYFFHNYKEIENISGPKFVLVHVLCPHPPWLFGPNGEHHPYPINPESVTAQQYKDQVQFLEKEVITMLDGLLKDTKDKPPLIVIQADHGTSTASPEFTNQDFIEQRFGILNAYYLPRGGEKVLYPSISPVNSFRAIFNYYFKANLKLLPDRSYMAPQLEPFTWVDMTDRLGRAGSTLTKGTDNIKIDLNNAANIHQNRNILDTD